MSDPSFYLPEGLPIPVPEPDGLSAPYWEGARKGELRVQRCKKCSTWQWGPEWICNKCHSFDVAWVAVEGKGRIHAWTRAHHPFHAALKTRGPYLFGVVTLPHAGGIRMLGNILGDAAIDPKIGEAVEAVFEHHEKADPPYTLVQWRRTGAG